MNLMKWLSRTSVIMILVFTTVFTTPVVTPQSNDQYNNKLDFVFLLHANQALVPYGDVANDLNYHGVLETYRNHPTVKLTIHISGTLISILQSFSPETLQLIQDGVDDGQFELSGSAFAQNVMYSQYIPGSQDSSAGDFDNNLQLKLHRQILLDKFGVEPKNFWNPERVWDPDLILPIIQDGGYQSTFIEDHIIHQVATSDEHLVRTTGDINNPLYVFSDDRDLIWNETTQQLGPVDKLARGPNTGDPASFDEDTIDEIMNYLNSVYLSDSNDEKTVVYAQDMEAWGLWQEESRIDSGGDWGDTLENVLARLDKLLQRFEQESSWLQLNHPSKIITELQAASYTFEHIDTIPFGEAMWMNHAAVSSGYSSWKAWQDSSVALAQYRNSFSWARTKLMEAEDLIQQAETNNFDITDIAFAKEVLNYMEFVYASNQFEFGCWGCDFPFWHRSQTVGIGAETISWILSTRETTETLSVDLDHDSFTDYIMRNGKAMYVFSAEGGRLIGWFDKVLDEILIYNDAEASYMEGGFSNMQEFKSNIGGFWGRSTKEFALREKAFSDYPRYSFTTNFAESSYSHGRTTDSLEFQHEEGDSKVLKTFKLGDESTRLSVNYVVENKRTDSMDFSIVNFYSPSNLDILLQGADNIEYVLDVDGKEIGIHNNRTGLIVGLEGIEEVISTSRRVPGLFSYGLQYDFNAVAAMATNSYSFSLMAISDDKVLGSDTTPPSVIVNVPSLEFSGIIDFLVDISDDDSGVDRIELYFEGEFISSREDSGIIQFFRSGLTNGIYEFEFRAYDNAGNVKSILIEMRYVGEEGDATTSVNRVGFSYFFVFVVLLPILRKSRFSNINQ